MDKLTKFDKENYILREICKNDEFKPKDWTKNDVIPKNSLYSIIKSLESNGFINIKARKPLVIDFSLKISQILLLIEKNIDVPYNELLKIFSNNNFDIMIKRLIDAKIIKMESKNNIIYFQVILKQNN